MKDSESQQNTSPPKKLIRIFLGEEFPNVYFSKREAECIYYLLKGKKRTETAVLLGLSVRTLDFYTDLFKKKIRCHSLREALAIIHKTEFLQNFEELMKKELPK